MNVFIIATADIFISFNFNFFFFPLLLFSNSILILILIFMFPLFWRGQHRSTCALFWRLWYTRHASDGGDAIAPRCEQPVKYLCTHHQTTEDVVFLSHGLETLLLPECEVCSWTFCYIIIFETDPESSDLVRTRWTIFETYPKDDFIGVPYISRDKDSTCLHRFVEIDQTPLLLSLYLEYF